MWEGCYYGVISIGGIPCSGGSVVLVFRCRKCGRPLAVVFLEKIGRVKYGHGGWKDITRMHNVVLPIRHDNPYIDVRIEWIKNLLGGRCPYCGAPIGDRPEEVRIYVAPKVKNGVRKAGTQPRSS